MRRLFFPTKGEPFSGDEPFIELKDFGTVECCSTKCVQNFLCQISDVQH